MKRSSKHEFAGGIEGFGGSQMPRAIPGQPEPEEREADAADRVGERKCAESDSSPPCLIECCTHIPADHDAAGATHGNSMVNGSGRKAGGCQRKRNARDQGCLQQGQGVSAGRRMRLSAAARGSGAPAERWRRCKS
jgi:hypothetical protein